MKADVGWAADIKRTRNHRDFLEWKTTDSYNKRSIGCSRPQT